MDGRAIARSALIGGVCGGFSGGVSGALSTYGVSQGVQDGADILVSAVSNVVETCWQANGNVTVSECVGSFVSGVNAGMVSVGASKVVRCINGGVFKRFSNGKKKALLNSNSYGKTYTTAMVRDNLYLDDAAYFECISKYTELAANSSSSIYTIGIELFWETEENK